MHKISITKTKYNNSDYFQNKYGKLKYVSESGNVYKTDKGNIVELIKEAREYIDDTSIEVESADEFIIFNDPDIFKQITSIQKKEVEEIKDEVQSGEVTKDEVADATSKAATKTAMATLASGIASSAINSAAHLATSKSALGLAAAIGYGGLLKKAGDVGEQVGDDLGNKYADWAGYNDNMNAGVEANAALKQAQSAMTNQLLNYAQKSNLGTNGSSDLAIQMDKRAMYLANQINSGGKIVGGGGKTLSIDQAKQELQNHGYEINDQGIVNRTKDWIDPKAATTGAATAAGASGWSLFGMSAATVGWIVAGVAAAAIITPYIYDKVRACSKTWLADIIAEVKFKADGKNYRCFYDLKENKWVLTYADIKWTSYLDNKLDPQTINEFFSSQFFQNFLTKCRQTFAMLYSTSKNEAVFKALPEIKDAPKELKDILEKIYDNKGAITRNLFTGKH